MKIIEICDLDFKRDFPVELIEANKKIDNLESSKNQLKTTFITLGLYAALMTLITINKCNEVIQLKHKYNEEY